MKYKTFSHLLKKLIMSAQPYLTLNIVEKSKITPNMIRIVLGGADLHDFPEGYEGGYVKLLFPAEGDHAIIDGKRPRMRSYTIRAYDKERQRLTLDLVVHGDNGPASAWALSGQVGSSIAIRGPGNVKQPDPAADWFFIAADMTALPAASVVLENLPEEANGVAVIEVLSQEDEQQLKHPKGVEIHWVHNPHPDHPNTLLVDRVKKQSWQSGQVGVWSACEFNSMRLLRQYFKKERQVGGKDMYISSYWKMGDSDEGHKLAKKADNPG